MPLRIAIVGLRHGHIHDIITRIRGRTDLQLVACCEDHEPTREQLRKDPNLPLSHSDYHRMLAEVPCDVVAIGDYYARRGVIALAALRAGRHVIGDKPLCTRLDELEAIEREAHDRRLCVGCMLDLRDNAVMLGLRDLVRAGTLGTVQAIDFQGQHPLFFGSRAGWYFEKDKHGGTINDIAIHALDAIPWLTGSPFARVNAARNWHVRPPEAPHFLDAAQLMLTLRNDCGVLGDVSYFAPDSFAYSLAQYWRLTVWGTDGMAEALCGKAQLSVCRSGEKTPRPIELPPARPGGYLDAFLRDIQRQPDDAGPSTATVLRSTRVTLAAQDAADHGRTNVDLP